MSDLCPDCLAQLSEQDVAPYFHLEAACDSNDATLRRTSVSDGTALYQSLDKLLNDPNIEAIGLFTGLLRRAELIQKIIESGRHVITTKPLEFDPPSFASDPP
jgi:predicted dehydrogenase